MRLARWLTRLMTFNFDIKYKKGKENIIPDYCSRFPLPESIYVIEDDSEETVLINSAHPDPKNFLQEAENCPQLREVRNLIQNGWPKSKLISTELMPFYKVREELSLCKGIIFKGKRIILPISLRKNIILRAHENHPGLFEPNTDYVHNIGGPT